jgi:ammonia channel protein AmtB
MTRVTRRSSVKFIQTLFLFQGLIAVGFFVDIDPLEDTTAGQRGVFHGGGWRLLGVQTLAVVAISGWSAIISFILLFVSICITVHPMSRLGLYLA